MNFSKSVLLPMALLIFFEIYEVHAGAIGKSWTLETITCLRNAVLNMLEKLDTAYDDKSENNVKSSTLYFKKFKAERDVGNEDAAPLPGTDDDKKMFLKYTGGAINYCATRILYFIDDNEKEGNPRANDYIIYEIIPKALREGILDIKQCDSDSFSQSPPEFIGASLLEIYKFLKFSSVPKPSFENYYQTRIVKG